MLSLEQVKNKRILRIHQYGRALRKKLVTRISQKNQNPGPEPPRTAKIATKQKPQGAGIGHEVESKKVSRRKSTENGTYAENMGKRKKTQCKHLDEHHQDEKKHQKD